ncbi:VOC family protein [Roseateles paludis]|jgi:methylmalonyl-CoA/ethylmalonyl-CoA epimerase|uniref:VOC family protein n=1 Tax=Roseateles paludis TaxID=3145238 RepID=A0ABV0G2A6_9BURK
MQTDTGITGIVQVALTVHDLDRATAFYRDTLGLRHLFSSNGMSFFDCGGVRLMLGLAEPGRPDHFSSIVYLRAPQIEQMAERLQARQVHFEQPLGMVAKLPHCEVWMALFRDSEGNLLGLMCER